MDELMATVASTRKTVWKAQFVLYVIRPLAHLLTMAYCACLLYAGTWIVVLALRHAGAIQ